MAGYGTTPTPTPTDFLVPVRAGTGRRRGTRVGAGGPLGQQAVWDALQRDLEACGIKAHRIHDLRHTTGEPERRRGHGRKCRRPVDARRVEPDRPAPVRGPEPGAAVRRDAEAQAQPEALPAPAPPRGGGVSVNSFGEPNGEGPETF